MKKIIFATLLMAGFTFAQDLQEAQIQEQTAQDTQVQAEATIAQPQISEFNLDSLRFEIEVLTALVEIQKLQNELDKFQSDDPDSRFGKKQFIQRHRERVEAHRQWREETLWGFGGGPMFGWMYMDMTPVRDILRFYEQGGHFIGMANFGGGQNFSQRINDREAVYFRGGSGFIGFGNGLIVGGGGYTARKGFSNNTFCRNMRATLDTEKTFGGFLLGYRFGNERNAFKISSFLGWGTIEVSGDFYDSLWWSPPIIVSDTWRSRFYGAEFHLSYVRSLKRWFHVGVEAAGLLIYSDGFSINTGSFTTFSPSARLRFIVGSI